MAWGYNSNPPHAQYQSTFQSRDGSRNQRRSPGRFQVPFQFTQPSQQLLQNQQQLQGQPSTSMQYSSTNQQQAFRQPYQNQPPMQQQLRNQQPMQRFQGQQPTPQQFQGQQPAQQPFQGQQPMQQQFQGQPPMQQFQAQQPMQQPFQGQPPMQQFQAQQPMQQPFQGQPSMQQQGRQQAQSQPKQPYDPRVSYEPISDDVLKLLGIDKSKLQPPEAQKAPAVQPPPSQPMPQESPVPPSMPLPPKTEELHKMESSPINTDKLLKMSQILQSEKNGAAFYSHLAEMCKASQNEGLGNLFMQIGDRSMKRADSLSRLFKDYNGQEIVTSDRPVFKVNNVAEAIKFAIREESYAIGEITDIYESENSEGFNKAIHAILYRKISDLGRLIGI